MSRRFDVLTGLCLILALAKAGSSSGMNLAAFDLEQLCIHSQPQQQQQQQQQSAQAEQHHSHDSTQLLQSILGTASIGVVHEGDGDEGE